MYVVSSKNTNAGNYSQALNYNYKDICVHRQGKGMLCFKNIEETDYNKKMKTISSYTYSTSCFIPYLYKRIVQTTSGTPVYEMSNRYTNLEKGSKRYELQLFSNSEFDRLRGTFIGQLFSNYSYGNPKNIIKVMGNTTETQTIAYTNVATSDLRLLGLPLKKTVKKAESKKSPWIEQIDITYDSKYNIAKKVSSVNTTYTTLEESYTYDSFGNVLTKSSKPYTSTNPLTTSYKYSANGNFLSEMTNSYGFKTTYAYDGRGKMIQEKITKSDYSV